jgi:integrase
VGNVASATYGGLRVQAVDHPGGLRSFVILDLEAGAVHWRAERFLARFGEGTQRAYAYHLVDHLRWLAATRRREDTVGIGDLRRYLGLCGMEHAGPFGVPWLERPLSGSALSARAACLKGYYLDVTAAEGVNVGLRAELSAKRLPGAAARDRAFLGHLAWPAPANPLLLGPAPPRRHPRMLPDGAATAILEAVGTARDRMIVTWLADSGMRIGELCGVWFCDLHLVKDHRCGQRSGPHVHVIRRANPNGARAKTARPASLAGGSVTGGTIRRASPAIAAYHEYLVEDYYRLRALAQHDLVLVQLAGERAGEPLTPHGARQMLARAGRRAGLGRVIPHAFRHTWASALTEATGGNTKAVADEGGWASAKTVEDTYAHLAGDHALEDALHQVWQAGR